MVKRKKSRRGNGLWHPLSSAGQIDGFRLTSRLPFQIVDGTLDAPASAVQHVGVDHGRFYILMPQKFLDRSYIVAAFQEMCRKGMAKLMTGGSLGQTCLPA